MCPRFADDWAIVSHGLAMYLLEGAADELGVACREENALARPARAFCALAATEPDERLRKAVSFFREAVARPDRVDKYLSLHPEISYGKGVEE